MNASEKLVRLNVERESVPMVVANLDGAIEFMSPDVCHWTGISSGRIGDVGSLIEHVQPDPVERESWRAWWYDGVQAKAAMGLDPAPFAVRVETPEGPRFVVVYTTIADSKAVMVLINETPPWHAARLLEVQRNLSASLLRSANIRECLLALLESAVCLPGLDCGVACLFDDDTGALGVIGSRGLSGVFVGAGIGLSADSWASGQVKSGQTLYAQASEIPDELAGWCAAERLKHLALIPVSNRQDVVGCLIVSSHRFERVGAPLRLGLEDLASRTGEVIGMIRVQEARGLAERQFRLAVESAALGIWMADLESGFVQACPRTRMLHGFAEDVLLDAESAILAVHPDDREGLSAGVRRAVANGEVFSGQYRALLGGDGWRWIAIEAHAFDESRGKRLYGVVRDITASKRTEAALIEARDHLELRVEQRTAELEAAHEALRKEHEVRQMAMNASQTGAWSWEIGQPLVNCDDRVRQLYGLECDEPIPFDRWLSRVHADDCKRLRDRMSGSMPSAGESEWCEEFRILHPDLGERWIAAVGKTHRDSKGQAVRFVGISFDVTKRRTAENKLRESEEKYRNLFESLVDGVVRMDLDGRILETNRSFQVMLGYSAHELGHLSNADITPEKWLAMETRVFKSQVLIQGQSAPYEKELKRTDGTPIPVEVRMFVVRDALRKPVSTWAIVRHISQRKETERLVREWNQRMEREVALRTEELTHSEVRFRQLAEFTLEGIAMIEDGILVDGTPQLAEMHGLQLSEMIGRPYSEFVVAGSRSLVAGSTLSDEDLTYEFVALRSDGSTFPAEARICTRSWQGRSVRLKAVRDVTAARQAAARLCSLKNELEHAQRLALVSEVSAGIVHQIGQPLSGMALNLEVLRNRARSHKDRTGDLIDIVNDLEADVVRLREAVKSLRSLANPGHLRRAPTDLNDLVSGVMRLLVREIDELGIVLHLDFGSDLRRVNLDSVQISQVILNLIRNAIEACAERPPGQRELRIHTCLVNGNQVEFSVRDSGPGIHSTVANSLFAPFLTTKPDGVGLGLRLSRTIVQSHGGTIEGSNNENASGAIFRVAFPAGTQTQ